MIEEGGLSQNRFDLVHALQKSKIDYRELIKFK